MLHERWECVSQLWEGWTTLGKEKLFTFSKKNKFTVIGCDDYGLISKKVGDNFSSGCIGLCSEVVDVVDGQCSGNGCCQTSIKKALRSTAYTLNSFRNHSSVWPFSRCGFAFLAEEGSFQFRGKKDISDDALEIWTRIRNSARVVVDWVIAYPQNCSTATECKENSFCEDVKDGGYRCRCKDGFEGNPYLDSGCQDIDECKNTDKFPCDGTCINIPGNYICKCKGGYSGDGKVQGGCHRKPFNVLRLSLGMGLAFLTLLTGISVLHFMYQKRNLIKLRESLFEQNGGVLLEDKLKRTGVSGVSFMIFRVEDLEEATDNYAEDRITGRGGNGIVYKGTLPDKRLVAIKKSQRLDQEQRGQFINEMIILAQLNHPNVVQLMGCCLETDVPLLAYEFVSNDTLYYHIHNITNGRGRLSWDSRLRIAHESAGALAYLHTDARMSIIHRDVKSTNILLDENYTAKIADFGASRLVPLGHDQVTTPVQGTLGYLDPEYFHTGQLTDKSDVYSFGVVLAELLTGKKPLGGGRDLEDRNLSTYFVKAKKENRLSTILDRQVVNEDAYEQLKAVSELVCRCLNIVGANRPSMKEVTMELKALRNLGKNHFWSPSEEMYTQTSRIMNESEECDLYTVPLVANNVPFVEYSSSSAVTQEILMLQVQNPR